MTNSDIRAFLAGCDPRAARTGCGITQAVIAAAVGCTRRTVGHWERRVSTPSGALGARYCRIIAGFQRHLAVTW